MYSEENLKKCEAYRKGLCLFGCDAVADNYFNSEEVLESNYFDYYSNNKVCKTLGKVKND